MSTQLDYRSTCFFRVWIVSYVPFCMTTHPMFRQGLVELSYDDAVTQFHNTAEGEFPRKTVGKTQVRNITFSESKCNFHFEKKLVQKRQPFFFQKKRGVCFSKSLVYMSLVDTSWLLLAPQVIKPEIQKLQASETPKQCTACRWAKSVELPPQLHISKQCFARFVPEYRNQKTTPAA